VRILANENIPRATVVQLREAGHDVESIADVAAGAPDSVVVERAVRDDRIVLTFDRDYGDLIFRQGMEAPPGIVFLRYHSSLTR
jgi:predicted nuclease of predicted toxin-antitoxin system